MKENFVALEQEKLSLLGDVHQIIVEKQKTQQQHGELALHVQQLEATIVSLQLEVLKEFIKSPRSVFPQNSMECGPNLEDSLSR